MEKQEAEAGGSLEELRAGSLVLSEAMKKEMSHTAEGEGPEMASGPYHAHTHKGKDLKINRTKKPQTKSQVGTDKIPFSSQRITI